MPDVPLNQLHHITLSFRLPVAEIDPHGNRQAKLRRHNLRVSVYKPSLANEKTHKPGEVMHDIRVILLGLQLSHLRILELLNCTILSQNSPDGYYNSANRAIPVFLSHR